MKQWRLLINGIERIAYKTQGVLLFIILSSIATLVFIQVILRYVLHHPLMGIEELLLFPTIWLYFLGSANASVERTQIKAQVIDIFLKTPLMLKFSRIVMGIISLGIDCWLIYWAFQYFKYSIRVHKLSATLYIPLVFAESAMFIGFLLMGIYALFETIDYITKPLSKFNLDGKG